MTGAGGSTPAAGPPSTPPPSESQPAAPDSGGGKVPQRDVGGSPWERRPTGVIGGLPTGARTRIAPREDESVRRSLERENECAELLAGLGYRVQQNPTAQDVANARAHTGDAGQPGKDPDYLIEEHVFDCYSPSEKRSVRNVWSGVSEKIEDGQTQRVVLNLQDWRGDLGALHKQFDAWPVNGLKELVAVTADGKVVQIVKRS